MSMTAGGMSSYNIIIYGDTLVGSKVNLCAEGQVCDGQYRLVNVVTKLYFY